MQELSRPEPAILELGPDFYDPVRPALFSKTHPCFLNQVWADQLGVRE